MEAANVDRAWFDDCPIQSNPVFRGRGGRDVFQCQYMLWIEKLQSESIELMGMIHDNRDSHLILLTHPGGTEEAQLITPQIRKLQEDFRGNAG